MVPPTSSMLLAAAPALFALSQTQEANPSGDHFAHLAQPKIGSTDAFQCCLKRLSSRLWGARQAQPSLGDCSGRCHARWCSHARLFGMNGPQLQFSASWGVPTPTSYDASLWERTHIGGGFSWCYSFAIATLPKAVWIVYPYLRSAKIACTSGITRPCFYPQYFTAEPVHDSVFKVLYYLERSIFKSVTLKYPTK